MKDFLLITPPFTQLNTPYPATAYLKGFLTTKNISSSQVDLGIEVILRLFSKTTLSEVFDSSKQGSTIVSENAQRIYALKDEYLSTIDEVIRFLQGNHPTLARNICSGNCLPEASRFEQLDDLEWAFGTMGMQDKAKHLATLYLEDISDFIVECLDADFGFSRYAERLGRSANSFDELWNKLENHPTYIDSLTLRILDQKIQSTHPKVVCFSVPFPGNLYSAFRCAQYIKRTYPKIHIAMGGGFPNTELRSLTDARVFDFFDFITLDDGELPIELVHNYVTQSGSLSDLKRTYTCENGVVMYHNLSKERDYKQSQVGTPDYSDLFLDQYISVIEIANPMHSLWSDGRWNKLTMAHGCYWGKCTFCDISLDYIKLYEPVAANLLVDRMEELIAQTGENGFHFVDEAAPPALMRALAIEIIRRKITVTWWTNIRFEKSFTQELCHLLKASGCIAVSGGLEVASDRLLALIQKGVTVEQVARVTRHLTESGIMVHAYLMYGYPTQTVQETVDSLEMVRQLFELGIIQSGFWHQFALTAHSPIGHDPESYGIIPDYPAVSFADNDIQFTDSTGIDHDQFSFGLKKSLFNYMHGIGFELPLNDWFDLHLPKTTIHHDYIASCLQSEVPPVAKLTSKPMWLGGIPEVSHYVKKKRNQTWEMTRLTVHTKKEVVEVQLPKEEGEWLIEQLPTLSIFSNHSQTIATLSDSFPSSNDFDLFWYSAAITQLRSHALLIG